MTTKKEERAALRAEQLAEEEAQVAIWQDKGTPQEIVAAVLARHPHAKLPVCPKCKHELIPSQARLALALLALEWEEHERQRNATLRRDDAAKATVRGLCDDNGLQGVHPLIDLFPMLEQTQLEQLAASIATIGQIYPITLDKDRVLLDGRNRLAACKLAGVTPRFSVYEGDDPVAFILSANVYGQSFTPEEIRGALEDESRLPEMQ